MLRIKVLAVLMGLLLFSGVLIAQPIGDSNDSPFATDPQPPSGKVIANTWTTLRWQPGSSAAVHELYISEDFNDVNEGTVEPILTTDTYQVVGSLGTPIPSGLAADTTYYWRVDEVNEADPNSPWRGEVWEFTVAPPTAWGPVPADMGKLIAGTSNVQLNWNAGLGAVFHYWYFSETFEDVDSAAVATGILTQETSFNPPAPLDLSKTYYWRIDEFDSGKRVFHRGVVWSFTVAQWVVVDNFEQYADNDPNWIWLAWRDGFETNGTGAVVGYLPGHDKPYTYETIIVRPGSTKSMPLYYDNSGDPNYPLDDGLGNSVDYGTRLMYSEATLPFAPAMNWFRHGDLTITTLMLWYRGNEDNALENVSIVIKDSSNRQAIVPVGSDMLKSTEWNQWSIDLTVDVPDPIDLTRILSLTIRIGRPDSTTPGGAGLLYIDDIGLVAE